MRERAKLKTPGVSLDAHKINKCFVIGIIKKKQRNKAQPKGGLVRGQARFGYKNARVSNHRSPIQVHYAIHLRDGNCQRERFCLQQHRAVAGHER